MATLHPSHSLEVVTLDEDEKNKIAEWLILKDSDPDRYQRDLDQLKAAALKTDLKGQRAIAILKLLKEEIPQLPPPEAPMTPAPPNPTCVAQTGRKRIEYMAGEGPVAPLEDGDQHLPN